MFKTFPREVGPPRKVVNNIQEWLAFVNRYNGLKKAVYTSIYMFKNINEKGKAEYDSAVVDCLFFDFDDKSCDAYKEANNLHQELLKQNLKHRIVMSGRGYHVYIMTEEYEPANPKSCIYNAQHSFIDKLQLEVDTQVIGNPAQLARVPNTYNQKGKRFCIPVTEEEFDKGDDFIKQLSSNQNFIKDIFMGEKLLNLKDFDYQSDKFSEDFKFDTSEFEDSFGNLDYAKGCPECIKQILMNEDAGWKERYLLILYFRELGYTRQEVYNILKEHLTERKFKHCIGDERQLQYLFERHDLMFPSCARIIADGMCPSKCEKYNKVIYK